MNVVSEVFVLHPSTHVYIKRQMMMTDLAQRKAMPKTAQTTAQLHSSHMLVK